MLVNNDEHKSSMKLHRKIEEKEGDAGDTGKICEAGRNVIAQTMNEDEEDDVKKYLFLYSNILQSCNLIT